MTKIANFRPNLVVLGQKIVVFTGESKSFGTHITEKPHRHLVCIVFGQAWYEIGQKCQYLAQNDQKCIFAAKLSSFWAKNPNLYGRKQKIWYPHNGKTTKAPCLHCFFGGAWDQMGQKCQHLAKNANIWPKMTILG